METFWEVTIEMQADGSWRWFRLPGTYREAVLEGLRAEGLPEYQGGLLHRIERAEGL